MSRLEFNLTLQQIDRASSAEANRLIRSLLDGNALAITDCRPGVSLAGRLEERRNSLMRRMRR